MDEPTKGVNVSLITPPDVPVQTGFGETDKVLENLNQGQKHKLENDVYNAMTNPLIKIKKMKFSPSPPIVVPKVEPIVKSEKSVHSGNGAKTTAKTMKKSHKFNVI